MTARERTDDQQRAVDSLRSVFAPNRLVARDKPEWGVVDVRVAGERYFVFPDGTIAVEEISAERATR